MGSERVKDGGLHSKCWSRTNATTVKFAPQKEAFYVLVVLMKWINAKSQRANCRDGRPVGGLYGQNGIIALIRPSDHCIGRSSTKGVQPSVGYLEITEFISMGLTVGAFQFLLIEPKYWKEAFCIQSPLQQHLQVPISFNCISGLLFGRHCPLPRAD